MHGNVWWLSWSRRKELPVSEYLHYAMIKRKKSFFSFNHSVHYTMVKTEKSFFLFSHCVHYIIIKREKSIFFIYPLRSLHHDQVRKKGFFQERKTFFFHLVTTFTTPWSRENKTFSHLVSMFTTPWSRQKTVFFYLVTTFTTL